MISLLVLAMAAPPTFEVTNHCPPAFKVTNHCPAVKAAPAVAAKGIFHNTTHNCPTCGRSQFVINGPGPLPGTHTHRCSYDGTVWYHP